MTNYNDFQLDEHQIDAVKKMHQKLAIMGYIKEHGSEPSDISEYYTATEDELELHRRAFYAQYTQNQPQQPNNEIWYTSTDGNIVELSGDYTGPQPISNTYSDGKGIMVFEDELTSIENYAFQNCRSLTNINIPSSVTNIRTDAFNGCSSLTGITIPSSVTRIEYEAFYGCSNLTDITIPESVTIIEYEAFADTGWYNNQGDGLLYLSNCLVGYKGDMPSGDVTIENGTRLIANGAFGECSSLTSIEIPSSVTSIGDYAFEGCSSLTSVTISEGVTSIEGGAFRGCSSLTNITIPSSVTSIGADAFTDTGWYNNQEDGLLYLSDCLVGQKKGYNITGDIVIEDGTRLIAGNALFQCWRLTSVNIPSSVISIGYFAFYGCENLTNITIPEGVTSIGVEAFGFCENLTSVTISSSVTSIENSAFDGCANLTNIYVAEGNPVYDSRNNCNAIIETNTNKLIAGCMDTVIPSSVTSIGNCAFWGRSITGITIPSSVTSIENYAFNGCTSLTSIEIPSSVTSIGSCAFYYCENLTDITIPEGITSIGSEAFCGCSSLTDITFDGTMVQWNAITKGDDWNGSVPATYVQCTDGQVQL